MKKIVFSFIIILMFIFPLSAFCMEDTFSYSFLSSDEQDSWSGCFYDESNPFGEGFCAFVSNPFGQEQNGYITHVTDYSKKIFLEAGNIYTLKGYILNPLNSSSQFVRAGATLSNNANTVIVNISGAYDEWAEFSTTFYAGETGEYNLSLHLLDGAVDFGFFIDEITLSPTPYILSSIQLRGQSEILIPSGRDFKATYVPYLVTSEGNQVDILSKNSVSFSVSDTPGVSYNPSELSLTVTPKAITNSVISIDCTLKNYKDMSPTTFKVTLTDNMIDDPSFSTNQKLWQSSANLSYIKEENNFCISVPTNDYSDWGYFASLVYEYPLLLIENTTYVLHARVKSDTDIPFSAIYAKNTATLEDNSVVFSIKDISGKDWIDVFAAFTPDVSGIYNIAINLCSTYDTSIYIDDIRLSSEVLSPTYLTVHAPGNIAIPDIATSYSVYALLRDQLGNIIDTDDISITLNENDGNVLFDSEKNLITVFPDSIAGKYTLTATYNADPFVSRTLSFDVSFDYFGDGGFENKTINEWWMVSSPYEYDFYIRNDGYSKRALINCRGSYFMLLNNSYVHLIENTPYVFNSNFSSAENASATLFIETVDMQTIPLAQIYIKGGTTLTDKLMPEIFLTEKNYIGRLFLYIESESFDSFSIYADNLSLKKASIVAGNLHITGEPFVNGAAEAQFSFYNSVAQNYNTSSCIINWYIQDSPASEFTMLDTVGKNIYFDTSFLNEYVYFEVIPVCPLTGFSGDRVKCSPFKITYNTYSSDAPTEKAFTIPSLSYDYTENLFNDINGHWAQNEINTLAQSYITEGRGNEIFAPDDYITRAEFSKLVATAFNVKAYSDFSPFTDINKNDWFYPYVGALNLTGIIHGVTQTEFSPHSNIKREDAIVMLMRVYEKLYTLPSYKEPDFNDSETVSDYAINYISAAWQKGFIKGDTSLNLKAYSPITRSEASALLCRIIKRITV